MPLKKTTNKPIISDNESTSDNESSSSDDEKPTIKASIKVEPIDDDSEEVEESDDDKSKSDTKIKEKKHKPLFIDLMVSINLDTEEIKILKKEIIDNKKSLEVKEKKLNNLEKQRDNNIKQLTKSHHEDIIKISKEKKKRKVGSSVSGFNQEKPIPEILIKFLGLEPGTSLSRPKVFSAFNNKFKELNLKNGQNTTLDKATVKALCLNESYEGKVIPFNEVQTFLATFYQIKTDNTVYVV